MLINDEMERQMLQLLVKETALPAPEAEQRSASLLQLNPGQQVKGEIIANLSNHLYLARVAGELFKVELPLNVQPGESVPLTFVGAQPRVVFALRPEVGNEAVRLSALGRWLAGAVQTETVRAPLLEHPPEDASLLAARLKESLTQGGLFYETHLCRWASGALPLQELFKEPQGKLSRALRRKEADPEARQENGVGDDRTLHLVQEQLRFVNHGTLSWKAEAWPGQSFELTIAAGDDDDGGRSLQTTVSLALPHLGEVRGTIRLDEEGVGMEIDASSEASAKRLRAGVADLVAAASASGLRLNRVMVRYGEKAQ